MSTSRFLAVFAVASSLAGCQPEAPPAPISGGSTVVVAPIAAAVTAPAPAVSASSATAPAAPVHHLALASIRTSLDARCTPKAAGMSNMELKQQMSDASDCVERAMNRDLDKVLLPLKASQPARFRLLMEQQATYRRFEGAMAFLGEETMWVDFVRGTRSDGTARSTGMMAATHSVWLERAVYAQALAAGDATALATEIKSRQKQGQKTRRALADIKGDSAHNTMVPPAPPGEDTGETVLGGADWKELFTHAAAADDAARDLARSTCEDFPGLESALGGAGPCREAVALYHLSSVTLEPMREDGVANRLGAANPAGIALSIRRMAPCTARCTRSTSSRTGPTGGSCWSRPIIAIPPRSSPRPSCRCSSR